MYRVGMPVVSHDEHRRHIADVTVGIIAQEGLEAATVRRIAAEVGCSTTIITHYFSDKHELLLWTYRMLGEFGHAEFEQTAPPDSRDLLGYLLSMAAVNERNIAYWRAYVAIWDKSLRDPEIAAELNSWISAVLDRIETFIQVLNSACPDKNAIARRLLAQVQGISIQRLFDPGSWSDEAMRHAFESEIDLLVHGKAAG